MMPRRLHLAPVGALGLDAELLGWLAGELQRRLGLVVHREPALPLRDRWFDPDRGQFRSNEVIDALIHHLPVDQDDPPGWVLALTEADLVAERRDFVFGEATLGGHWALVSLHRLRSPELPRFRRRVLTEALHELGHLAGRPHCPDPACVMHPSADVDGTDRKAPRFCSRCMPPVTSSPGA